LLNPLRPTFFGVFSLLCWFAVGLLAVFAYLGAGLPNIDHLFAARTSTSLVIYDVRGERIARRGLAERWVELRDLPPHVSKAVRAIEDRRFYDHAGIDPLGLARAVVANIRAGEVVQGGSTLTQQLAKNLFLEPDRTIERKAREALLALWLESKYSKDEILTLYLNKVYFGAGAYGIEAAARRYFGKSARELDLGEAAMLAGLLKAPSKLAPTTDRTAALARTELVLGAMLDAGMIGEAEYNAAKRDPLSVQVRAATPGANYFADWIAQRLPGYVSQYEGELRVETTLDLRYQRVAEEALADRLSTEGLQKNATQGAVVSLAPDGAIRVMAGGKSYRESQYNRAVHARRQPGSAFKPFVFLAALESGLAPLDTVLDAPVTVGRWSPGNYTDRFEGEVTLTTALAKSLNTPAVRLSETSGRRAVVEVAKRLGIRSRLAPHASIALGSLETTLLELTGAYTPFANGGEYVLPYGILRIVTEEGEVLYERSPAPLGRVIRPREQVMMRDMLAATVAWGTGRRAQLEGREVAGKTGTSQAFRDAWFIGFTADLITGVWVGNDDNSSMDEITGGTLPAEVFARFMQRAVGHLPAQPLIAAKQPEASDAEGGEDGGGLGDFLLRLVLPDTEDRKKERPPEARDEVARNTPSAYPESDR